MNLKRLIKATSIYAIMAVTSTTFAIPLSFATSSIVAHAYDDDDDESEEQQDEDDDWIKPDDDKKKCSIDTSEDPFDDISGSKPVNGTTAMVFAKKYKKYFIEAWGKYGYLPSANLTQIQIETSFNVNVPSFGQAHNTGGVKWYDGRRSYDVYKAGGLSEGGAGTSVGDNTGGAYANFKTYGAGILGKAEFVYRNSLYKNAVNNTSLPSTIHAIRAGGWATAPDYETAWLNAAKSSAFDQQWLKDLDEEAFKKYGRSPAKLPSSTGIMGDIGGSKADSDEASPDDPCKSDDTGGSSVDSKTVDEFVKKHMGKMIGDSQCYALSSEWVSEISGGKYQIGTGKGARLKSIGDTVAAKNLWNGWDWKSIGWKAWASPTPKQLKPGDIISIDSSLIWPSLASSAQYGHTGVVTKIDGNKVTYFNQAQSFAPRLDTIDYDRYGSKVFTGAVRPNGLDDKDK